MALEEPCLNRQGRISPSPGHPEAIARGGAFPKLTRLRGMQGDRRGIFYPPLEGGDPPTLLPLKNPFHA